MFKLISSLLCLFIIPIVSVIAQGPCKTPVNENGKCVPVKTCSIIVDILENIPKPWPQRAVNYVQKSHCGVFNNEHYVCCSERHITTNPKNTDGFIIMRDNEDDANLDDIKNHPSLKLLPLNECGRINADRLSFANISALSEFPWTVLLQYDTTIGLRFQCGGSLISSRYVLTAAHCVTGIGDELVSVRVGEYDTSTDIDCDTSESEEEFCAPPVQDIKIEQVVYHPDYNHPRFANDVAIIRLAEEAKINRESVYPICLPHTKKAFEQSISRATLTGWGLTEKQTASNVLLKATIPILPNEECQKIFRKFFRITPSQICAGGEGSVDSCKGDSGGPLFYSGQIQTVRYVQYGIISAGASYCGNAENYPGIYTRVTHFLKWILDNMKP